MSNVTRRRSNSFFLTLSPTENVSVAGTTVAATFAAAPFLGIPLFDEDERLDTSRRGSWDIVVKRREAHNQVIRKTMMRLQIAS
jgi:hypothetical protein